MALKTKIFNFINYDEKLENMYNIPIDMHNIIYIFFFVSA